MLLLIYFSCILAAVLYEDSGWLIALALFDIADAIGKRGKVER